jgi:ribosomal-protein-alanine N-acetyltransferase
LKIRKGEISDLAEVVELEKEIFKDEAYSEPMIRASFENPISRYFILEDGGKIIGYAFAYHLPASLSADLHNIGIAEAYRGKGHASRLLDSVIEWLLGEGAEELMLEVKVDNADAIALYESRGFEIISRRVGYYQPSNIDGFVMRARIKK